MLGIVPGIGQTRSVIKDVADYGSGAFVLLAVVREAFGACVDGHALGWIIGIEV